MISTETRTINLGPKDGSIAIHIAESLRSAEDYSIENLGIYTGKTPTFNSRDTTLNALHENTKTVRSTSPIHDFAFLSLGLTPRVQAVLAAALIDIVNLRGYPNETSWVKASPVFFAAPKTWKKSITVSQNLRVERDNALRTTLLAPSGAYLSWLEMESSNGRN